MFTINANTKISELLKQHPEALEVIINISPKFNKLRNPVLRKLMASRASITMASKIAGISTQIFFDKLKPLGFEFDNKIIAESNEGLKTIPEFMQKIQQQKPHELDVREIIESGKDPLNLILQKIKEVRQGEILKLINSFEPIPLIQLLGKQGFESYTENMEENHVITYFHRSSVKNIAEPGIKDNSSDFDKIFSNFENNLVTVDVRELEMPLPMLTILEELDKLPEDKALFVYHKRIPIFLLPELADRKLDYRIKQISDTEVHLLIYKE